MSATPVTPSDYATRKTQYTFITTLIECLVIIAWQYMIDESVLNTYLLGKYSALFPPLSHTFLFPPPYYTTREMKFSIIMIPDWISCYDCMTEDDRGECLGAYLLGKHIALFTSCECSYYDTKGCLGIEGFALPLCHETALYTKQRCYLEKNI